MTADEIWHSLYDIGLNGRSDRFNDKQLDLFYFIDFIYQIEIDGSSGFIYNQTPTTVGENFYEPYIRCWKSFEMTKLVEHAENYNNQFLKALELYEKNGSSDFEKYENEFQLKAIQNHFCEIIDLAYRTQEIVWSWMENNIEELTENLKLPTWWNKNE